MSSKSEVARPAIDFSADAGSGFQEARADSYSLPFFRILQSMSVQTKKSDGAYVPGAEEGMFINSATLNLYPGTPGVVVVPCYFTQRLVERKTRENGGNFVAEHMPESPIANSVTQDAKGRNVLPNGNELNDVRTHYCLLLPEYPKQQPAIPIVVSLGSTQRRKSRRWMSVMQGILVDTPSGPAPAPMFSRLYRLTTVPEKNDNGSWWGWNIALEGEVTEPLLYTQAKAFASVVRSGNAKVNHEEATE